jgi:hypothetical protein
VPRATQAGEKRAEIPVKREFPDHRNIFSREKKKIHQGRKISPLISGARADPPRDRNFRCKGGPSKDLAGRQKYPPVSRKNFFPKSQRASGVEPVTLGLVKV